MAAECVWHSLQGKGFVGFRNNIWVGLKTQKSVFSINLNIKKK